jgi:hypothetical protein
VAVERNAGAHNVGEGHRDAASLVVGSEGERWPPLTLDHANVRDWLLNDFMFDVLICRLRRHCKRSRGLSSRLKER